MMSWYTIKAILLHVPVGLATVGFIAFNAPTGILFGVGFLFYEAIQEYVADDKGKSHRDVQGWLVGMVMGIPIWFLSTLC